MQRFSRKRQAVLDCLASVKTHPTADWLYETLRPAYPDLSLATVYRNLRDLQEAGLVRSVGVVAGKERFDATVAEHPHFVCTVCGKVADAPFELPAALGKAAADSGFRVTETALTLRGICADCQKKKP